ncbi:MAG: hypothetical protein E6J26_01770 [Chloroflexi bacterium]|nr:MAG: hypothetical protein E6J26_01770 [Chloroflexota bacterium]
MEAGNRAAQPRIVHAHQRQRFGAHPRFLERFTDHGFGWRLAHRHCAAGHGPQAVVRAADQQNLASGVDDRRIARRKRRRARKERPAQRLKLVQGKPAGQCERLRRNPLDTQIIIAVVNVL